MAKTLPRALSLLLLTCAVAQPAAAQETLIEQQEAALRAAVAEVAPSVVQIQTIGGLERVGKVLFGSGPTTGLIVSEDGYIISSAFNFAQKPSSILVGLADGTRTPAKLVATDESRMLVLLKVQVEEKLPVPSIAPQDVMKVGQWAVAVGRTYESTEPNISVGIVSALQRIWGKAIQTDAKVSPVNYGGPLIDIQGRVLGVLVPLSPQASGKVAGVEWYDSGIGFAIPLQHVMTVLPKLKEGKDLHPGIVGVTLKPGHQFASPAEIAAVRANSPAYEAGFKAGDVIIDIDGMKIVRQSQVKEAVGHRYAEEVVSITVTREGKELTEKLKLVAELQPYRRPLLGILPMRVAKADDADGEESDDKAAPPQGVAVRYVYRESGADLAGITPGDVIIGIVGAEPLADADALRAAIAAMQPEQKVKLQVRRGDSVREVEVQLGLQVEDVPAELPPALAERKPYLGEQPAVGKQEIKVAEYENTCHLYVPEGYDPSVAHGLVLWLHEPNGLNKEEQVEKFFARWKTHCDEHNLILVAPKSQDPKQWVPAKEVPFIAKVLEQIRQSYLVDEERIIAHGYQAGGAMAYAVAFNQREVVRGVAAIDAPIAGRPPENDPVHPLRFLVTTAKEGRTKAGLIQNTLKSLRNKKYPVTLIDQGPQGRHLNPREQEELVRWIDTLDRI